ncbi:MAG TPA: GDSL-type esterase/lipase family protein [Deferrisomatales bacterium]|nr:GDSL-type esterase/lipase family protein [Deferrisomatales bacterium]
MPCKRRTWIIGIGMIVLLAACDRGQIFHKLRPDSVILAFGDGLTFGTDVERESSYPAQLEALIRRKVVNAGVAGEDSAAGVRRLPRVLAEQEPDLVILGQGLEPDRQRQQGNLRRMFEAVNQLGIPVVMIAVLPPGGAASDVDPYTALAKELKIPLVHAAVEGLPTERQTEGEQVRWTASGCRKLAEAVADKLDELSAI